MRCDFYVYVLLDPRKPGRFEYGSLQFDHEPFYVGKGKGRRDASHARLGNLLHDSKRIRSTKKVNKIRKIISVGLVPIIKRIKTNATEAVAFKLEAKAILLIGRNELGPLTNATDGGDGVSGYVWSDADKMRLKEFWKDWHASLTATQKLERAAIFSQRNLERYAALTPEQRMLLGRAISKGAQSRTPEERAALTEKFRQVQLTLPVEVQKLKNKRTKRGLKKFYATRADVHYLEVSAKQSDSGKEYWDSISETERTSRADAIKAGYAKKSKRSINAKNSKIADSIKAQHAKQSPFDARMRSYMVMVGLMMRNANVVDDDLKAKLRAKGTRFYSKTDNLELKPSGLREKVRKLIAA